MLRRDQKIIVDYNGSVSIGSKMEVLLRIDNWFGMVTNVCAYFNRRGESPGEEANCRLNYVPELSNSNYSTFKGSIVFATEGYRTFFIGFLLNGEERVLGYNDNFIPIISVNHQYNFWQVYVYQKGFKVPEWMAGGIMYQIYVDTFFSKDLPEHLKSKIVSWDTFPKWRPNADGEYTNDQFYGGNLKGIIAKLDYLKALNVTVIYLTPVFKSQSSNRYDIDDYEQIDEMVGTWEDFKELRNKANNLGIKIVLDVVFNHSGNGNALIKAEPEMYDWIIPNVEAKCWWGYKNLVEFNKYSNRYFTHLYKWLKLYRNYVDGIRLDVADNLPDHVLKFIRENFDSYILGEVWKHAIIGDNRDFLIGDKLDGVMNYITSNAIIRYLRWGNFQYFCKEMELLKLYPPQTLDVSPIFLSSHDTPRIINTLVGDFIQEDVTAETVWAMEIDSYWRMNGRFDTFKFRSWEAEHDQVDASQIDIARQLKKMAVFMQYTLPGLPSVFAGEEAGVQGYKDPFNRKPFPWNNIDSDMYEFYVKMGKYRMEHREVFADSTNFKVIKATSSELVYKRGEITFVINRLTRTMQII